MSTGAISLFSAQPNQQIDRAIPGVSHEITLLFFSYLSLKDLAQASCVCKEWKQVANDNSLYDLKKLFSPLNIIDEKDWNNLGNLNGELEINVETLNIAGKRKLIFDLTNKLKELSAVEIENNAGWTLLTIPKGLTYNKTKRILFEIFTPLCEARSAANASAFAYCGISVESGKKRTFKKSKFDNCIPLQGCGDIPIPATYRILISNECVKGSSCIDPHKHKDFLKIKSRYPKTIEAAALMGFSYKMEKFVYEIAMIRCVEVKEDYSATAGWLHGIKTPFFSYDDFNFKPSAGFNFTNVGVALVLDL